MVYIQRLITGAGGGGGGAPTEWRRR